MPISINCWKNYSFYKLPPQIRTILAGSSRPFLELITQRADDILAKISPGQFTNANTAQQLQNQMFKQGFNKLTDAVERSLNL